ncbi:MAG: amidohydrolase [Candidatus Saganbacteria bacterium]|nr:amidohydrolase [Candidatus Saganbacteria bacterium]
MSSQIDLIVKNALIITVDPGFSILENTSLAIDKGKIIAIGDVSTYKASKIIDGTGKVVMPGLINSHTHAAMVLLRGFADDLSLEEWWPKYMFPTEKKIANPKTIDIGVSLACLEMIKSGTTSFCDMYFCIDEAAQAVKRVGMRGVLGEVLFDFPSPDGFASYKEGLAYTDDLVKKYREDDLIQIAVMPHSTYTCSPEVFMACKEFAEKRRLLLHTHLSETKTEMQQIREKYGKTPTEYFAEMGLLSPNLSCAHCVWMTDYDLELLAKHQVSVCHSPESNMKLASGIAPVEKMLRMGINVALATDGAASNNNLDLITEMDSAAKLHKVDGLNPTFLPARQIIQMATINGAKAYGMDGWLGSVEVGKVADLILLDLNKPHLTPSYNIVSDIVYSANGADVDTVIINGKVIMEERKILTVDEQEIIKKASAEGQRIYREYKLENKG